MLQKKNKRKLNSIKIPINQVSNNRFQHGPMNTLPKSFLWNEVDNEEISLETSNCKLQINGGIYLFVTKF